jgi:serine/threonine protein kinase
MVNGLPTFLHPRELSLSHARTEVWQGKPYNASVDVYSFGVVLFEMISLRHAYDFCTAEDSGQFALEIFDRDQRPPLARLKAPPSIKDVLPFCWNNSPEYRWDMATVNQTLRQELILLRKGDESRLPDFARRRSTYIPPSRGHRDCSLRSAEESVRSILTPHSNPGKQQHQQRTGGGGRINIKVLDVVSLSGSLPSKGSLGTSNNQGS